MIKHSFIQIIYSVDNIYRMSIKKYTYGSSCSQSSYGNLTFGESIESLEIQQLKSQVQTHTSAIKILQMELNLLKSKVEKQPSNSFEGETLQAVRARIEDANKTAILEFLEARAKESKGAELKELFDFISSKTFDGDIVFLESDDFNYLMESTNMILKRTKHSIRQDFLNLCDHLSKKAGLFDKKNPALDSGPLYDEKVSLIAARIHSLFFKGASIFKNKESNASFAAPSSGKSSRFYFISLYLND